MYLQIYWVISLSKHSSLLLNDGFGFRQIYCRLFCRSFSLNSKAQSVIFSSDSINCSTDSLDSECINLNFSNLMYALGIIHYLQLFLFLFWTSGIYFFNEQNVMMLKVWKTYPAVLYILNCVSPTCQGLCPQFPPTFNVSNSNLFL